MVYDLNGKTSLRAGALQTSGAGRYTLDNVEAAHAAYEERRMIGKPVLEIIIK